MDKNKEDTENLVDLKKVEKLFTDGMDVLKASVEKAQAEAKDAGTASVETKAAIEKQAETLNELGDRIQEIEQKGVKIADSDDGPYDIGAEFIKTEQFKALQDGSTGRARMEIKTAIINATGQINHWLPLIVCLVLIRLKTVI